jgi:polar amino acid transport system substrate-binding protein
MRKALLTALMILGLTASPSRAITIVFGTDATWPPMEFVDSQNGIGGFAIDYMKAAGKEAGFKAEFEFADWSGLFTGLAQGQYDAVCSSVSVTAQRTKNMDFSQPYFSVSQALVVRADSPAKSLTDLRGKNVGVLSDTTGQAAAAKTPGVVLRPYGYSGLSLEDILTGAPPQAISVLLRQQLIWLLEDLASGRLDGVVCDDAVAVLLVRQTPRFHGKLKIAGSVEALGPESYAVAVRKGDKATLALIDEGIRAVKAKGIDKDLARKWLVR